MYQLTRLTNLIYIHADNLSFFSNNLLCKPLFYIVNYFCRQHVINSESRQHETFLITLLTHTHTHPIVVLLSCSMSNVQYALHCRSISLTFSKLCFSAITMATFFTSKSSTHRCAEQNTRAIHYWARVWFITPPQNIGSNEFKWKLELQIYLSTLNSYRII